MTLQLYILRSLLHSFCFALTGISMVVLPTILIQAVHKLGGVSLASVLTYLPLVGVELVPYILPMAFLLSLVSTFGRLAAERELTAIRMAGIHPAKLCIPTLLLAAGLGLWTHHLVAEVAPAYKYRARNYLLEARTEAFMAMPPGHSHLSFGKLSMDWLGKDSGGILHGVSVRREGKDGDKLNFFAKTAKVEFLRDENDEIIFSVDFNDCEYQQADMWAKIESPSFKAPLAEVFPTDRYNSNRAKYMPSSELERLRQRPGASAESSTEYQFEINRRRALSITCLIFVLLGIPTGIGLRSGTQLAAFTSAMGLGFLYFIGALELGSSLFKSGSMEALPAAWATAAIFSILGFVLSYRTLWR